MDQKAFVCKAIEAKQELYDRIADQIWQYAEAGIGSSMVDMGKGVDT